MRGISQLGELCENVLQYRDRRLQNVIVPIAQGAEALGGQSSVPRVVASRRCVLAPIDLNHDALVEADEIKDEVLEGDLATKLEMRELPIT